MFCGGVSWGYLLGEGGTRAYSRPGNEVCAEGCTASELAVGRVDTGVDDVDRHSGACGGVVDVGGGTRVAVRDTAQSPWGTSLGC